MNSFLLLLSLLGQNQRAIEIPPWIETDKGYAAACFTLNTIAHSGRLHQPVLQGNTIIVDLSVMQIDRNTWDSLPNPYTTVRLDHFITQALDSHYHEFMRYPATLDQTLETVGANVKISESLNGDQRIGLTISNITGKPRRIDRIQGLVGRNNTGAVWITRDIKDNNEVKNPFYALLNFTEDASEIIFERPNGTHGFILADGQGNLVREAPPDIASDHTIPTPHTRGLRSAISCIRCHATDDGLKPAENHVKKLFEVGVQPINNREQLLDLYSGNFDRRLKIGRDDYNLAVRTVTSMPTKPEGLSVAEASAVVSKIYGDYKYNSVTGVQAALELNIDNLDPITIVDPTIEALRIGIPVSRSTWEAIYLPALESLESLEP